MSGPGPREPPQAQAGGPAGPEGADAALGEAGLSFTTTDLSLVEMTEVEYTQLQHILYSHMEAAAEGELETRLNSAFLAAGGATAGGATAAGGGAAPVYPLLCPPALADGGGFAGANPCLGHIDFQELRMMLLSEAGAPPAAAAAEKTPGADGPGPGAARPKAPDAAGKENAAAAEGAPEARAKSAVRVRLEDRFNSMPAEAPSAPRGAEPPEPGVALNKWVPGRGRAAGREGCPACGGRKGCCAEAARSLWPPPQRGPAPPGRGWGDPGREALSVKCSFLCGRVASRWSDPSAL